MVTNEQIRKRKSYRFWNDQYVHFRDMGYTHQQITDILTWADTLLDDRHAYGYDQTAAASLESLNLVLEERR